MSFCAGGITISDQGMAKNYTQPTDGNELSISTKYATSDACPAGQSAKLDEARCKYLLNRPIFECGQGGDAISQDAKYGPSPLSPPFPTGSLILSP